MPEDRKNGTEGNWQGQKRYFTFIQRHNRLWDPQNELSTHAETDNFTEY